MSKTALIPLEAIDSPQGKRLINAITMSRTNRNVQVQQTVEKIFTTIKAKGDKALFEYTKKFDGKIIDTKTVRLKPDYIASQAKKVSAPLKKTIREAAKRIKEYHREQKINQEFTLNTPEGILRQITRPLNRVGVYIPGGYTTYPSTVLMNVIPAQIAGVKEIVAVTPPHDELDPNIAFVLTILKISEVYQIGGAQAVCALAYGTKTIRSVDKIVGPGNSYVAMAKKMVYGIVDIDCVAGPSEVAILVDNSVNPNWVALDLLSQAEHGSGDETAVCVTEDRQYAKRIQAALREEIEQSPVKNVFSKLPTNAISIFIGKDRNQSLNFINQIASEHLQIMTRSYSEDLKKITNAAAIFLGSHTPVALGDYFIGTNHVLPTGSAARYASPLGVDSFIKRISVAQITKNGLKKATPHVSRFARAENFIHHALSVERRV